jgi:hypothetical protein
MIVSINWQSLVRAPCCKCPRPDANSVGTPCMVYFHKHLATPVGRKRWKFSGKPSPYSTSPLVRSENGRGEDTPNQCLRLTDSASRHTEAIHKHMILLQIHDPTPVASGMIFKVPTDLYEPPWLWTLSASGHIQLPMVVPHSHPPSLAMASTRNTNHCSCLKSES